MNLMRHGSRIVCLLLAVMLSTSAGCGLVSQLNYWVYGLKVEPKFKGLEDKKVAVVCVSGPTVSPDSNPAMIANVVGTILGGELKGVQIISQAKIADWMDRNDWNQVEYADVGKGVQADFVIGIDLESFSVREGQTLYKGKADVSVLVLDMQKDGQVVYGPVPKHVEFPENAAQHAVESEANFRKLYIYTLSQKIARDFYAYDKIEETAPDKAIYSN